MRAWINKPIVGGFLTGVLTAFLLWGIANVNHNYKRQIRTLYDEYRRCYALGQDANCPDPSEIDWSKVNI